MRERFLGGPIFADFFLACFRGRQGVEGEDEDKGEVGDRGKGRDEGEERVKMRCLTTHDMSAITLSRTGSSESPVA